MGGVRIEDATGALSGGIAGIVGLTVGSRVVIPVAAPLCDGTNVDGDGGALVAPGLLVLDCEAR
jgi:hypothetical protein